MRAVIIMIPFLLFYGCGGQDCPLDREIEAKQVNIPIERLEKELFNCRSADEVEKFIQENRTFAEIFLDSKEYPHDSILSNRIYSLIKNESIDTLFSESVNRYTDLKSVTEVLEDAVGKLQTLYPETKVPKLQTVVTGLYKDLFISDSLIIVGLDFFIGKDATYTPMDIPGYVLRRYNKEHLASIIIKFMAGRHISKGNSDTMLSEMIDFGKTYYLASRLAPCTPDSILLGYTPADMALIHKNEPIIWASFLENEVLYETSHVIKRKFLGERPNVFEIDEKCPGRIGAWVGWRIVESYMENNDVSIKELISEIDNTKIFRQSGYKPQSH